MVKNTEENLDSFMDVSVKTWEKRLGALSQPLCQSDIGGVRPQLASANLLVFVETACVFMNDWDSRGWRRGF